MAASIIKCRGGLLNRHQVFGLFSLSLVAWLEASMPAVHANADNYELGIVSEGGRRTTSAVCFTDGTAKYAQKNSMVYGSFSTFYTLDADDKFGNNSVAALGDIDGDGVVDLAIGAYIDDDGGSGAGAAYIVFLQTDGSAKDVQKLSMLYGNFNTFYTLSSGDGFGQPVAALGDADSDGVLDTAVGAFLDDDGGSNAGAVYIIFMKTDGTAKNVQKLSNLYGNLNTFYTIDAGDRFGRRC